jgi:hypothetical protein
VVVITDFESDNNEASHHPRSSANFFFSTLRLLELQAIEQVQGMFSIAHLEPEIEVVTSELG